MIGPFEQSARTMSRCSCEGSLHIAEKLRIQQGLGDSSKINGYEGTVCTTRSIMDALRHQFLSRTTLRLDEHGGVRISKALGDANR